MYGLATRKNMFLDRPTSHGGWPEGEYDPPVNDRIYNYLKSMGLMSESHLRKYIRNVLLETKTDQEIEAKEAISSLKASTKTLPDDFIQKTLDPIMGNYVTNPAVRRETDAVLGTIDDAATWASVGLVSLGTLLTLTGVGATVGVPIATSAGATMSLGGATIAAGSAVGIGNNTLQATAEIARGDYAAAGTHVALALLDAVIGNAAQKFVEIISARAGSAAAARTASLRAQVAANPARAARIAAGLYHNPEEVRLARAIARSHRGSRRAAEEITTFLGATTAALLIEFLGNSLTDLAQGYDDRRKAEGLAPNQELTRPVRDLAARLTSGKIEIADIDLIVTKAVGLKIIKKEDMQVLYDVLLYESEGMSPN
jgi:hypothetical protein